MSASLKLNNKNKINSIIACARARVPTEFFQIFLSIQQNAEKVAVPCLILRAERGSSQMISALGPESKCLGLRSGQLIVLCSWAKHLTVTVLLSTQECKRIPKNCQESLMK